METRESLDPKDTKDLMVCQESQGLLVHKEWKALGDPKVMLELREQGVGVARLDPRDLMVRMGRRETEDKQVLQGLQDLLEPRPLEAPLTHMLEDSTVELLMKLMLSWRASSKLWIYTRSCTTLGAHREQRNHQPRAALTSILKTMTLRMTTTGLIQMAGASVML